MLKNINILEKENGFDFSTLLLGAVVVITAYTIPYLAYFMR